jgi:hypothetical protein
MKGKRNGEIKKKKKRHYHRVKGKWRNGERAQKTTTIKL